MKSTLLLTLVVFLTFANAQTNPHNASDKKPKAITLKTGESELLTYDAGTVRFLATADDTNGAWSMVEITENPVTRPGFTDTSTPTKPITFSKASSPRRSVTSCMSSCGLVHFDPTRHTTCSRNLGKVPVRVLLTMTPSGFEESFRDRTELFKTAKPDDPNFIKKREEMMTRKKYDREFLGDWNPKK